jgi:hypothetical protein
VAWHGDQEIDVALPQNHQAIHPLSRRNGDSHSTAYVIDTYEARFPLDGAAKYRLIN